VNGITDQNTLVKNSHKNAKRNIKFLRHFGISKDVFIKAAFAAAFGMFCLPMGAALGQNANPPANPSAKATATPDPNAQKVEVIATPQIKATTAPKIADPATRFASLGETLNTIALQTGFTPSELAAKNKLTRPGLLIYGQKIQLPKEANRLSVVYEVQPGDTLSFIAGRFNVSPYAIRRANALACANCIFTRQLVRVPRPVASSGQAMAAPAQITPTNTTSAPQPFAAIDFSPAQPHAGDVVVVRVTTTVPLSNMTGLFAGRPLRFVPAGDSGGRGYIALSGVGVLDDPGIKTVSVRAFAPSSAPEEVGGQVIVPAYSYGFETVTVTKSLVGLLDPVVNQKELDDFAKIYGQWSSGQFWSGPFTVPVSGTRVTSYFGARRSYNAGILFGYHSGMDVSTSVGTPVRAMASGRVVAVQTFPVRGNVIVIDHGRGVMTTYCHLSQWKAKVGDFVKQGDVIALSGNTGRSEGPHVHFELAVGGVTVDPRDWLSKTLP
jgi:murein DD-endopeptidase MepM/ murein hydrolase activator NlpD